MKGLSPVFLALSFLGASLLGTSAAHADVVTSLGNGFVETVRADEESGVGAELSWAPVRPDDACEPFDVPESCGLASMTVVWEPKNLPVTFKIVRDRSGVRGLGVTMISDPMSRQACWSDLSLRQPENTTVAAFRESTVTRLAAWSKSCDVLPDVLRKEIDDAWENAKEQFAAELTYLWAVRDKAFIPAEPEYGFGTFLPAQISQPLLDMIADVCGSANKPRLEANGSIVWTEDRRQVGLPGGRSPDGCVEFQIKYFPGYPKAN